MITANDLAGGFARNLSIIQRQTEGLTHAEALLQPPFRGNCLNWVLGHIAESRNGVLRLLGCAPILSEAEAKRYGYGSEPVLEDADDVLRLDDLLARLERSQTALSEALARATEARLSAPFEGPYGPTTVALWVFHLYFHDCYHTGATELLRQLAGKNDKVI